MSHECWVLALVILSQSAVGDFSVFKHLASVSRRSHPDETDNGVSVGNASTCMHSAVLDVFEQLPALMQFRKCGEDHSCF